MAAEERIILDVKPELREIVAASLEWAIAKARQAKAADAAVSHNGSTSAFTTARIQMAAAELRFSETFLALEQEDMDAFLSLSRVKESV